MTGAERLMATENRHWQLTLTTSSKADPDPAGDGVGIVVPTPKLPVVVHIDGQSRCPLSGDSGAHDRAVVTFAGSVEGGRWSGDAGKAGRDREGPSTGTRVPRPL